MKHPHYDKIVAKAANMDLIMFVKRPDAEWVACDDRVLPHISEYEYFLCLPQHKKACLYWLNGGQVQWSDEVKDWSSKSDYVDDPIGRECFSGNAFLLHDNKFRIKPKKEKRWIGVAKDKTTDTTFKTKEGCMEYVKGEYIPSFVDDCQFIEIEVEV